MINSFQASFSSCAFKYNLRRYTAVEEACNEIAAFRAIEVRRCRLTASKSVLKPPTLSALEAII